MTQVEVRGGEGYICLATWVPVRMHKKTMHLYLYWFFIGSQIKSYKVFLSSDQ